MPACPEGGISLTPRSRRVITPVDSVHRTVAMAAERGTLQHLIFDNHALASHRAMAAILGAILPFLRSSDRWPRASWAPGASKSSFQ